METLRGSLKHQLIRWLLLQDCQLLLQLEFQPSLLQMEKYLSKKDQGCLYTHLKN